MQTSPSSSSSSSTASVSIASDAPRSVDDALNSSTWFQQQRFWEETTRVQTQLLALLQKQQTNKTTTTTSEVKPRRPRRNSVSPVSQSTFKKTSTAASSTTFPTFPTSEPIAARRRGSWSSSTMAAATHSAAFLGLADEATAVSAMQLLALAHTTSKRDAKRAQGSTSPFGKAKEAEPYSSFDDTGDLQPQPDNDSPSASSHKTFASFSSPASHSAPMQERSNVMSISALLN